MLKKVFKKIKKKQLEDIIDYVQKLVKLLKKSISVYFNDNVILKKENESFKIKLRNFKL